MFVHNISPVIDHPDPYILETSVIKEGMLLQGTEKCYNHLCSHILPAIKPTDKKLGFALGLDNYL